jgi:hypothetical protein
MFNWKTLYWEGVQADMSGKRLLPFVLLGLVVLLGCSQGAGHQTPISTPGATDAPPAPAEDLKNQLTSLAEIGEMMPGMETIGDNIAAIKANDAEKGAALEKDFEALNQAMGNPEQVKAKAKEMLGKIGGGAP